MPWIILKQLEFLSHQFLNLERQRVKVSLETVEATILHDEA